MRGIEYMYMLSESINSYTTRHGKLNISIMLKAHDADRLKFSSFVYP